MAFLSKLRYSEIKDYDFNRGGYKSGTGHFTQIVWKGSTRLGVGIATRGSKVVVVARYSPAGNFMRRFKEHVHRQKPGGKAYINLSPLINFSPVDLIILQNSIILFSTPIQNLDS